MENKAHSHLYARLRTQRFHGFAFFSKKTIEKSGAVKIKRSDSKWLQTGKT